MVPKRFNPRTGNRVDHVIWVVKPENASRYVKMLGDLFGATFDFRDGKALGAGFNVWLAFGAGLEVVSPFETGPGLGGLFYEHLQTRGEGFWGLVYGVEEIEEAARQAREAGWPVESLLQNPDDNARRAQLATWTKSVLDLKEIIVGEFVGTKLLIGQVEYAEHSHD